MHDLKLLRAQGGERFMGQPTSLFPGSTYRYKKLLICFYSCRRFRVPHISRFISSFFLNLTLLLSLTFYFSLSFFYSSIFLSLSFHFHVSILHYLCPHIHLLREAESAYVFTGTTLSPIFKRWSREVSPPELYNHGFENMESMGMFFLNHLYSS